MRPTLLPPFFLRFFSFKMQWNACVACRRCTWKLTGALRLRIQEAQHPESRLLTFRTAGQTSLNKELKPKVKVKAKAKDKARYVMKTTKKKGSNSVICAIVDNNTGKQLLQLSNFADHQNKRTVATMVEDLNACRKTVARAKLEFDGIKKGMQFQRAPDSAPDAQSSS